MEGLDRILREHPFFAGLSDADLHFVAGCARNHRFDAGDYLLREGQAANEFFLIRHGRVALEIAAPGQAPSVLLTPGAGEMVGVSWLAPPYKWMYDARAMELVRAIGIDAACLRNKCEADPRLGYEFSKRLMPVLVRRLHATRLQHLDVYGVR